MASSTIKKQAVVLSTPWYPVVFGSTKHHHYYAALPPIPSNATLERVNALGLADLPLSDFTLTANGYNGQNYICTDNTDHLFTEAIQVKLNF